MITPSVPPMVRESIVLGPGTAVPVPYFDPRAAEAEPSTNMLWAVLHALRRRWFAIAVLGIVLGCSVGALTWFLVKSQYTAVVRLLIPDRDESLVIENRVINEDYNLKKRTEQQTVTGFEVLSSTLTEIDPTKFAELRDLTPDERLTYLRECVTASFQQDSKIMELRVRCLDRRTAEKLAEKISEVYLRTQDEVLNFRRETVEGLRTKLAELTAEFKQQQNLLTMQEKLEAPDVAAMTPAEQTQLREFNAHLQRRESLATEIFETEIALAVLQQHTGDDAESSIVSDEELNAAAELISDFQNLRSRIDVLKQQRDTAGDRFTPGSQGFTDEVAKKDRAIKDAETELAGMLDRLRQSLEQDKLATTTVTDPTILEHRLTVLRSTLETMKQNEPPGVAAAAGGGPDRTASIEMYRIEVANLKDQMDQVRDQLNSADNMRLADIQRQKEIGIRRMDQRVYVLDDDDSRRKLIQSGAAGGAAFIAVSTIIVLFDLRRRRLNDTGDVSDHLQINVLGTVPLLRGRGDKRLEQSARLAEAVDGVAATLLCRTAGEDHRVVMISSAMAGEGKTTLAANLATSLAAAGRRTLLIDFDLRRPMLHQVYQVPIGPGLGELLPSDDLSNYVNYLQETVTEGLWLITAGAKRQRAIAELADARVAELFTACKEHFEFIIVDGPPVLPVVDTRLVARHADGVVMSLLRDVSELPKVKSACQLLQSYRVRILGGVVIGASGDVYYGYPPERATNTA
ncbi:MAG: AAA family ATPase [Planctomycetaceae bacterium]|nr:AAA family ATPase [Planctomycetaceae bacterium]